MKSYECNCSILFVENLILSKSQFESYAGMSPRGYPFKWFGNNFDTFHLDSTNSEKFPNTNMEIYRNNILKHTECFCTKDSALVSNYSIDVLHLLKLWNRRQGWQCRYLWDLVKSDGSTFHELYQILWNLGWIQKWFKYQASSGSLKSYLDTYKYNKPNWSKSFRTKYYMASHMNQSEQELLIHSISCNRILVALHLANDQSPAMNPTKPNQQSFPWGGGRLQNMHTAWHSNPENRTSISQKLYLTYLVNL